MNTKLASIFALAVAAAGCSSNTPSKGNFELALVGFDVHAGSTIYLKVKDAAGATLGSSAATAGSNVGIPVNGVLEDGKEYHADFFADTNGDGKYQPPPDPKAIDWPEHSWRITFTGKASGVTETY